MRSHSAAQNEFEAGREADPEAMFHAGTEIRSRLRRRNRERRNYWCPIYDPLRTTRMKLFHYNNSYTLCLRHTYLDLPVGVGNPLPEILDTDLAHTCHPYRRHA